MEGELGELLCADLRVNTRTVQILLVGGGGGLDGCQVDINKLYRGQRATVRRNKSLYEIKNGTKIVHLLTK